ncbi:MAG: DUF4230 domain-containing protein [Thermoguttaceae bacterium]
MKTIVELILLAVFAGLLVCLRQFHVEQPPVVTSQGPTIERLERLSSLVTSRVYVVDVLIGEGEGCHGAWLIRGDSLIAVNLRQAAIVEKDESAKRATIRLPQPEILQARVDHEKTRTWEVRTTTWIPWNADQDKLRDAVMVQAQRLVAHSAGSKENIEQAKRAAEVIIGALYEEVGWNVKVVWAETPITQPASDANAVTAGTGQH